MQIGILQSGQAPEALRGQMGDYPSFFERLLAGRGLTFRTWHVEAMEFPGSPHAADGWLITGSRHGAYEDHGFIPRLEAFIRAAYAESVPMVGICFGHQLIAQALGGKVEKFAGGWNVGPQEYDFGGETVTLNAWHQDQVTMAPEQARRIASNAMCENAALVYGDRAFTIQAHPEFRDDFVGALIEARGRGMVPEALLDAAKRRLGTPNSAAVMADRIADFFKTRKV